jgi:RNA polymerase sigma-70 factor (ECF subfamily)
LAEKTDQELMAATGRGDLDALGILFDRHHARVHGLCYRLTGDASVADDLVQESFLRILKYRKGFGARAAFTTWLYRLVRNVCMDHLKAEATNRARTGHMVLEQQHERDPSDSGEADPRLEALRSALYGLAPDKREVLVLSRYEGLSYAEIADVCGTTVGAIKVRAHRAMRELRQQFEELERANEV